MEVDRETGALEQDIGRALRWLLAEAIRACFLAGALIAGIIVAAQVID